MSPIAAPKRTAPPAAVPARSIATARAVPISSAALASARRCRATAERAGTAPASSRSQRPVSSSPRVIRVALSSAHTPTRTATNVPVRQTVNPPGSSSATGSPNSVRIAGFSARARSDSTSKASANTCRYWTATRAGSPAPATSTISARA